MSKHLVILGVGSNLGNRIDTIKNAIFNLSCEGILPQTISSYYETEPWGLKNQKDFMNVVLLATTELNPMHVLQVTQGIELNMGRIRKEHYGPRIIDLDILFYDQLILKTKALTIPHPQIHKRNFVLIPLQEIMPDFKHPILNLSIDKLTQMSNDPGRVTKLQRHETLS